MHATPWLALASLVVPPAHALAQDPPKPLPDAEVVGLETMTVEAFNDLVRAHCDGKY